MLQSCIAGFDSAERSLEGAGLRLRGDADEDGRESQLMGRHSVGEEDLWPSKGLSDGLRECEEG